MLSHKELKAQALKNRDVQLAYEALEDKYALGRELLFQSESFDYTQWQTNLWPDKDVDAIFDAAKRFQLEQSENAC